MSCSGCLIPAVMFLTIFSSLFCPGWPITADLSRLTCQADLHVWDDLSRLTCINCSTSSVLSQLFCPTCPVSVIVSQWPFPYCHVTLVLSSLSCSGCTIPAALSSNPVPSVLSRQPYLGCPVPVVLSSLTRPGTNVPSSTFPRYPVLAAMFGPSGPICPVPAILPRCPDLSVLS